MTWRPNGEPQTIGAGTRQYLESGHSHEGGHEVLLDGFTLRALPDGRTTPRNRSQAIAGALQTIEELRGAVCKYEGLEEPVEFDAVAYLVGSLILAGATNLHLDGEPVLPAADTPNAQWVVELRGDGTVEARYLGGDR